MKKFTFKNGKVDTKNQMSLQKGQNSPKKYQQNQLKKVMDSGKTTKYHLMLKDPFKLEEIDPVDPTCLWKVPLPSALSCRKRMFAIKNLQYVIPQWTGDGYPNVIYIDCKNVKGYCDAYGTPSTHVAALQITQISPTVDESGIKSVDLKYNLKSAVCWSPEPTADFLSFSIKVDLDTVDMQLPLPNSMIMGIDIIIQ